MASANVTLPGSSTHEFEVDSDERTATLQKPGGFLYNSGEADAFVNVDGGTVVTTSPLGAAGMVLFPRMALAREPQGRA